MRHPGLLNALLVGVAIGLAAYVGWQVVRPAPAGPPPAPPARPAVPAAAPAPPAAPAAAGGDFGVIASRNLFNPGRSESPTPAVASTEAAAALPRPHLYGVVLRDGTDGPIAYLEDPATRQVAGYRVGDSVAGGTVQTIAADRVVLERPEGRVSVQLRDPTKPRAPAVAAAEPGEAAPAPAEAEATLPSDPRGAGRPGPPTRLRPDSPRTTRARPPWGSNLLRRLRPQPPASQSPADD